MRSTGSDPRVQFLGAQGRDAQGLVLLQLASRSMSSQPCKSDVQKQEATPEACTCRAVVLMPNRAEKTPDPFSCGAADLKAA